jgi:predicted ATPase/DNA-binding CsgD family transcriptional regulator
MPASGPAVASSFVGRTGELAALARLVGRERLVTVVGPGGCGKTRLTIEAFRAATGTVHGFVELAAAGPATDLARAVLEGCTATQEPGRSATDQLYERLGDREGLLVLDNCEHLRREVAGLVDELLRRCPPLRVLTTSRVSLGVAGESVLPLVGLDPTGDAVTLLLDRARRVQPDLPSDAATETVAREICLLADGLPLAVELAAAHARALPLADIRDGMADRMRFLAARDPAGLPRHSSLASSLDWSADLVGESARQALAALSVVDGRFPPEVALAVTGGDRSALETLVDHSLVQFDAIEGRYLLLDTVHEYAARLLAASGAGEKAHQRLLDWAVAFARDVRDGLERAQPDVLRRVDATDAAVASALARAVIGGRGRDVAATVAVDLVFAWSLRGRCAEGLDRVRRLAAVLDPVPPPLRWAEAFLTAYAGDMETAIGIATETAETAEDDRTRGRALTLVAMVLQFVDTVAAEQILTEAAELAERAADDWCHVEALQVLAYCRIMCADLAGTTAAVDAALPALNRLGHAQLRAWDAGLRAEVAASRGQFAEAEILARKGLGLAVAVGEPVSAMGALHPLVCALVASGRLDAARVVIAEHRDFFVTHPGLGVAEAVLLVEAWAGEAPPEAALAAAVAAQLTWIAAEAGELVALARLESGDAAGALAATDAVAAAAERLGYRGLWCRLGLTRAAAQRALGDGDPAEDAHAALAEAARLGLLPVVADGLDLVAALAVDAGREAVAARLNGAAERVRRELEAPPSTLSRLLVTALPDEPEVAAARAEGARLDVGRAVAYAARSRGRRARPRSGWESLTPTEGEVVALAAQGLSNAAIGLQLLVTAGTVRTHLRSVFGKLGVSSRAELAAIAARRGL